MSSAKDTHNSSPTDPPQLRYLDVYGCDWLQDLRCVGVEPDLPPTFRLGVPVLALGMLVAAALVAFMAPEAGRSAGPAAFALLAAASLPWIRWGPGDDDGPSWIFATMALAPVALLGFGPRFGGTFGLASDPAYLLATALLLLVALLYVAFAPHRMAAGVTIAAYGAFAAPLLTDLVTGHSTLDPTASVMWHLSFAFCVAAGYGVRLAYNTGKELGEVREALARQAMADERRQIARDVHDVVAHTLAITMLHVTAARMAVRRSSPVEAEEALEEAERHGRASLADIRRIVRLLRSDGGPALEAAQPGLADVPSLVEGYRAAGLPVDLSYTVDEMRVSAAAELAVYRVLQEALANAARHGCGPATVELQTIDGALSLGVANPFQEDAVRPSRGSGLLGMRERIAAAGGAIETSVRDGRWQVRATVPSEART